MVAEESELDTGRMVPLIQVFRIKGNEMNVHEQLCYKDPRNPMFKYSYGDDEEKPIPREKDCACDNCFYGRDALAVEILALQQKLNPSKWNEAEMRAWHSYCGRARVLALPEGFVNPREAIKKAFFEGWNGSTFNTPEQAWEVSESKKVYDAKE